jgi:hypothetical protein
MEGGRGGGELREGGGRRKRERAKWRVHNGDIGGEGDAFFDEKYGEEVASPPFFRHARL